MANSRAYKIAASAGKVETVEIAWNSSSSPNVHGGYQVSICRQKLNKDFDSRESAARAAFQFIRKSISKIPEVL